MGYHDKILYSEEVIGKDEVWKFIEKNSIDQRNIQAITVDHNIFTIFYWK